MLSDVVIPCGFAEAVDQELCCWLLRSFGAGHPCLFSLASGERVSFSCMATVPQERREQRSWPEGRRAGARSQRKAPKIRPPHTRALRTVPVLQVREPAAGFADSPSMDAGAVAEQLPKLFEGWIAWRRASWLPVGCTGSQPRNLRRRQSRFPRWQPRPSGQSPPMSRNKAA